MRKAESIRAGPRRAAAERPGPPRAHRASPPAEKASRDDRPRARATVRCHGSAASLFCRHSRLLLPLSPGVIP